MKMWFETKLEFEQDSDLSDCSLAVTADLQISPYVFSDKKHLKILLWNSLQDENTAIFINRKRSIPNRWKNLRQFVFKEHFQNCVQQA